MLCLTFKRQRTVSGGKTPQSVLLPWENSNDELRSFKLVWFWTVLILTQRQVPLAQLYLQKFRNSSNRGITACDGDHLFLSSHTEGQFSKCVTLSSKTPIGRMFTIKMISCRQFIDLFQTHVWLRLLLTNANFFHRETFFKRNAEIQAV